MRGNSARALKRARRKPRSFRPRHRDSRRLAYLGIRRGEKEKGAELLNRGWIFIAQRIDFNDFWGNFIAGRRRANLLGELLLIDEEAPRIFDLFHCLRVAREYPLLFDGGRHSVSTFEDEGKKRVHFGEGTFPSVEDFFRKAVPGEKRVYSFEYKGDYPLRRKSHE